MSEDTTDGQSVTFWKHTKKPFAYVLISEKIDEQQFRMLFPAAVQIDEEEFAQLHDAEDGPEIITVADDTILAQIVTEEDVEPEQE